jgi:hypothetical protein
MKKPRLAGVPDCLVTVWLERLADGCLHPDDQRELHNVLVHKLSGKPGAPGLVGPKIKRRFHAGVREEWVQREIARLKAAGRPSPGGYRAEALERCAARWGWKSGEALDAWLKRNR